MTQDSKPTILVINPNSNLTVTQAIEQAVEPLRFANGPAIKCIGMSNGPLGIETQSDADCVVMPLINLVRDDTTSAAFVVACYSEPGVIGCREATRRPI